MTCSNCKIYAHSLDSSVQQIKGLNEEICAVRERERRAWRYVFYSIVAVLVNVGVNLWSSYGS